MDATKWICFFLTIPLPLPPPIITAPAGHFLWSGKRDFETLASSDATSGCGPWLKLEAASNHPWDGKVDSTSYQYRKKLSSSEFYCKLVPTKYAKNNFIMFLHVFWHWHGAHHFFSVLLSRTFGYCRDATHNQLENIFKNIYLHEISQTNWLAQSSWLLSANDMYRFHDPRTQRSDDPEETGRDASLRSSILPGPASR